jgi:hypothetical protein
MKYRHCLSVAGALSLTSLPVAGANADIKRECIDASTAGQTSRDAGKLLEARAQLLTCAGDACPSVVRSSCSRWLSDVEEQIPSIVIRAADAAHVDITEGTATIDGSPASLDGKPISLDPGPHLVVVEAPDGMRLEKKVLLAAGEKSRLLELRAESIAAPRDSQGPRLLPPTRNTGHASAPMGPWLLGGTSLLALGSFTYFALTAKKELRELQATCSPSCEPTAADAGKRDALLADVSLGVSVAALAGALTWALLSSSGEGQANTQLSVGPSAHGGFATLRSTF